MTPKKTNPLLSSPNKRRDDIQISRSHAIKLLFLKNPIQF